MTRLTEHQVKYVAYKLIHRWAAEAKESGGGGDDEFLEVLHDGGGTFEEDYESEFEANHEAIITELDNILSYLDNEAGKNDV